MEKAHLSVMKATQGLKNNLSSRVQKLQGEGISFVCLESEEFDNSRTAAVSRARSLSGQLPLLTLVSSCIHPSTRLHWPHHGQVEGEKF